MIDTAGPPSNPYISKHPFYANELYTICIFRYSCLKSSRAGFSLAFPDPSFVALQQVGCNLLAPYVLLAAPPRPSSPPTCP